MKKGKVSSVVLSVVLVMTLAACAGKVEDVPNTVPEATEATDTAADNAESTEAASEEPEVVQNAYFEENNIKFTDKKEFTVPFAAGTYDPDNLEYKEYKGISVAPSSDATITLGEIKPAKCDKDGYKAYTIDYTIKGDIRVTVDTFDYDENYYFEPQFPHIDMADYYTGNLLTYYPSLERKPDGKNKYDYIDKLSFNNKGYELAYFNLESYGDSVEGDWRIDESAEDSRMQWYDVTVSENHTIEIRMPEDYDGLVLAVNLNGVTQYDTSAFFEYMGSKDRLVFDEDPTGYTYKPGKSEFIRFNDLNQ
ncbi:MAG: hypothetical protein IK123_00925 [Lachnospiraceae bacterium]|nr:hypothetical protein [Lachnospiraceae bacterium]